MSIKEPRGAFSRLTKQSSRPFLIAEVSQPSDHLRGLPLQQIHIILVLKTPGHSAAGGISSEKRGSIISLNLLATLLLLQPRIRLAFWAFHLPVTSSPSLFSVHIPLSADPVTLL